MDHMSEPRVCPNAETIERLRQGKLTALQLDELRRHASQCPSCAAQLSGESTTIIRSDVETFWSSNADGASESPPASTDAYATQGAFASMTTNLLQPSELPDEIGRLGRFRVLETLGAGGMGVVFRAEDPQLRRQVALKAMIPRVANDPAAKQRFVREAQATAAIDHDNIVAIYEVNEESETPYLVMQLLRGESLQTRIERMGPLPEQQILRIAREVARGLEAAHQQGLIHRDIKPANIWLESGSERVKILDFGLVHVEFEDDGLTQAGAVMGTPRFMSPEQATGHKVDLRSDLFSLGSVMYFMASGRSPFVGDSLAETLIAVAQCAPEPVEVAGASISKPLANQISRLLEKDPGDRPRSASEAARSIEKIEAQMAEGRASNFLDGASQNASSQRASEDATVPSSEQSAPMNHLAGRICLAAMLTIVVGGIGVVLVGRYGQSTAKHEETSKRTTDPQALAPDSSGTAQAREENGVSKLDSLPSNAQPTAAAPILRLLYGDRPSRTGKQREVALTLDVEAIISPSTNPSPLAMGGTLRTAADQYAIHIKTLTEGHLYVIQVDAAGRCFWIYPKNETLPEWSFGANPVSAETPIQLPPGASDSMFVLDSTTGIEHIYAVLSPEPWPELESSLLRLASESDEVRIGEPFRLGLRGIGGIAQTPSSPQPRRYTSERGEPLVVEWWFEHAPAMNSPASE